MASNAVFSPSTIKLGDLFELDLGAYELRRAGQPQGLRAGESLVPHPLAAAVLAPSYAVHRFVQMLKHMKLIERDLAFRVGQCTRVDSR